MVSEDGSDVKSGRDMAAIAQVNVAIGLFFAVRFSFFLFLFGIFSFFSFLFSVASSLPVIAD
jgi:hypothetical protein